MPLTCPFCDSFSLTGPSLSTPHSSSQTQPKPHNLTCTACQAQIPFNHLPLFLITGPSGSGKSTLLRNLRQHLPTCLVVGADLLTDISNRDPLVSPTLAPRRLRRSPIRQTYRSRGCG